MPRILLAEVHDATRAAVQAALVACGHDVLLAADLRAVPELYAAQRPDAVVAGADVPGLEGLVQRLRQLDPRLLLLVADIYALVQVWGSRAEQNTKLLWTLLIVLAPFLGLAIWFFVPGPGRKA